jgi:hypothetical protein
MSSFSWPRNGERSHSTERGRTHKSPRKRAAFRPRLDVLDDRCLLSFTTPVYYPTGTAPQAVVTADVNGDGKLDLVSANMGTYDSTGTYIGGGGISVLLGTTSSGKKGSTTSGFAPAQNYAVGSTASVVVGDINGDNKPDIVADNGSVLLNNGDGTFRTGPSIAGGVGAYPTLIDVNGDGKLDLVAGWDTGTQSSPSSTISVLLGHGDGSFRISSTYTLPDFLYSVVVGNFNGDSKPDIIVANRNSLSLMPGNGDGTFGAAQTIASFAPGTFLLSVVAARFNADANLDLAVASFEDTDFNSFPSVEFLMGHGDGTFTSDSTGYGFDVSLTGFAGMAAADINHDGKMDLVGVGSGYPTISVLPGNGDGTFGATQDFTAFTGGATVGSPTSFVIGDFNGDGYLDVAIAGQGFTVGDGYGVDVYLWSPKKH